MMKPSASIITLDISLDTLFIADASAIYQKSVQDVHKAYREEVLKITPPPKKRGRRKKVRTNAWVEGGKKSYKKNHKSKDILYDLSKYFSADPDALVGLSICTACYTPKPLDNFRLQNRKRKRRDGSEKSTTLRSTACRACEARKVADWRKNPDNKEKVAKLKAKFPEYYAKWAAKNKEKLKLINKVRYAKKKELKNKTKVL